MSSEELNGEEQQIPAEDITEQQESDLQNASVINDTEIEQPVDQVSKLV